MSNPLEHQATELVEAFKDLINIERTKAKLDVYTIIKDGHEAAQSPYAIIQDILTWVGTDSK